LLSTYATVATSGFKWFLSLKSCESVKSPSEICCTLELMLTSYNHAQERSKYESNLLCVDPVIVSIKVTDITQRSVRVSWSTGQTHVVSSSVVYHRASGTTSWVSSPARGSTTHTVSTLQPGTQYQFYVTVVSSGKTWTSDKANVTTGKCS